MDGSVGKDLSKPGIHNHEETLFSHLAGRPFIGLSLAHNRNTKILAKLVSLLLLFTHTRQQLCDHNCIVATLFLGINDHSSRSFKVTEEKERENNNLKSEEEKTERPQGENLECAKPKVDYTETLLCAIVPPIGN